MKIENQLLRKVPPTSFSAIISTNARFNFEQFLGLNRVKVSYSS